MFCYLGEIFTQPLFQHQHTGGWRCRSWQHPSMCWGENAVLLFALAVTHCQHSLL